MHSSDALHHSYSLLWTNVGSLWTPPSQFCRRCLNWCRSSEKPSPSSPVLSTLPIFKWASTGNSASLLIPCQSPLSAATQMHTAAHFTAIFVSMRRPCQRLSRLLRRHMIDLSHIDVALIDGWRAHKRKTERARRRNLPPPPPAPSWGSRRVSRLSRQLWTLERTWPTVTLSRRHWNIVFSPDWGSQCDPVAAQRVRCLSRCCGMMALQRQRTVDGSLM